mmetsp:Transcript_11419/g.15373  ORF Transcript_11419/g.15373 Transcript_11419/m.15373 type:complete len:86 (-) Transcript_11419:829-1086(-)
MTRKTNTPTTVFFLRFDCCSSYVRVTTMTVCCCDTGHFSSSLLSRGEVYEDDTKEPEWFTSYKIGVDVKKLAPPVSFAMFSAPMF